MATISDEAWQGSTNEHGPECGSMHNDMMENEHDAESENMHMGSATKETKRPIIEEVL